MLTSAERYEGRSKSPVTRPWRRMEMLQTTLFFNTITTEFNAFATFFSQTVNWTTVRENVWNTAKNRKKVTFFGFWKKKR